MNIKIIIASRNREDSLFETIKSIVNNKIPDYINVSLIIVENEIKSNIEEKLSIIRASCKIKIIYCFLPFKGKSKALNFAIKNNCAPGDLILFTDDDSIVNSEWIVNYYKAALKNGTNCFFGGGIKIPDDVVLTKPFRQPFLIASIKGIDENHNYDGLFIGPNWGAFYDSIEKCGFFDEHIGPGMRIYLGDETFLQEKLLKIGLKKIFITNNSVIHNLQKKRITLNDILAKSYMVGRRRVYCQLETGNILSYFYKMNKFFLKMIINLFNDEKRFKHQFHMAYHFGVIMEKSRKLLIIKYFK
jgi:GT2 family glycosyltransferase